MEKITKILCLVLCLVGAFAGFGTLSANPTGGQVAAGSVGISSSGSTLTVRQASNAAIINWQSFSINSGELTKFIQPSATSAVLNRVLGGSTSYLNGTLSANGQVYLINGNGIMVGPGGLINTQSFTASTRDISDSDFLAGNLHFTGNGDGGVQNLGTINALGGNVYLLGKTVDNEGAINAANGTAGLAAGDDVLLNDGGEEHVFVSPTSTATSAAGQTGVNNSGTISAASAELKAANGNIYALAVNNSGLIRASTVTHQGGHIWLTTDSGGVVNSGTLDASATAAGGKGGSILVKSATGSVVHSGKILARGGQGGTGGNAEVSGQTVQLPGSIDLTAPGGLTGDFLIDPAIFTVAPTGGNETGAQVAADLAGANTTVMAGTTLQIKDAITWTADTTLTLQTTTSTSPTTISITKAISGVNGGLTIDTASPTDAVSDSAAVNVSAFILQNGKWVQNGSLLNPLTDDPPAFTASSDFEIHNGTFLRITGGSGTTDDPYQLVDIYGVQGIKGFLGSSFILNSFIDASGTATWNPVTVNDVTTYSGFVPIGTEATPYTGTFNGNGNTIQNLTINLPNTNEVGLFGSVGSAGTVESIDLETPSITGQNYVGGITGDNFGTLQSDTVGNAFGSGSDGSITGNQTPSGQFVGGIAGYNESTGTISGGQAESAVAGFNAVGGVAGENDSLIQSVTVGGSVTGATQVGGVAGLNSSTATIDSSNFAGAVFGDYAFGSEEVVISGIGGLAGENDGMINNSNTFPNASVTDNSEEGNNLGGLVGYNTINATIENSYNAGTVDGNRNVGGIAGENDGYIVASYNAGSVSGNEAVGGIAGLNFYVSPFPPAPVDGDGGDGGGGGIVVTLNIKANGIEAPSVPAGTIDTTYNIGSVSGSSDVGGLVGDNYGFVQNSYNSGSVSGEFCCTTGGLVGFDEEGTNVSTDEGETTFIDGSTVQNCYWDVTTSGQTVATNNDGSENYTESNLIGLNDGSDESLSPYLACNYSNFGDISKVSGSQGVSAIGTSPLGGPAWYIINGQTRPLLAMEYNTNIQNAHQVQLMAVDPTATYYNSLPSTQNNTIDMSETSSASGVWNPETGFVPVGSSCNPFTGTFFGNGVTLDELSIDRPGFVDVDLSVDAIGGSTHKNHKEKNSEAESSSDDVGLFGVSSGNVDNVNLTNATITGGDSDVGGLVGNNSGSVSGSVEGSVTGGGGNVGGLVGDNSGYVSGSMDGTVTGGGNGVGGIVGTNENGATIFQTDNNATVESTEGSEGIGGIAGINDGTVSQSINTGTIADGETMVGGIVGDNFGTVDDSYSTGSVTGGSIVGGLVGQNESGAVLEMSYSTSPVSGSSSVGTLIGDEEDGGIVSHVYWETCVEGNPCVGIGQDNDESESITDMIGYTAAQLTDITHFAQGTSPGLWDFSPLKDDYSTGGTWGVNVYNSNGVINGGLPVLQWQYPVYVQITASPQTIQYGTTSATLDQSQYSATGPAASYLTNFLPNGPTLALAGTNVNAGTTDTIIINGTPEYDNIEYINGTATIIPKTVTVTLVAPICKVYDGNTTATLTSDNYQINGIVGTDTLVLNDPTTGTYDTKDVGTNKAVTVTGLAIDTEDSSDPGNYTLNEVTSVTDDVGTITKAPLSISLQGTVTKVYDGTTTANLAQGNYSVGGLVGEESVTVGSSSTYDTPDVGTEKTVTADNLAISGADAGNYFLCTTSAQAGIGTITPAPLTITANGQTVLVGQPVPPFTATYTGLVDSQSPSVLSGELSFVVDPTPFTAVGNYTITPSGQSSESGDYAITYRNGTLRIVNVDLGENQPNATVESELATIITDSNPPPPGGVPPPTVELLGETTGPGAVNDDFSGDYLAFGSSTLGLPALSRLVTPGLGIVTLSNGTVVVGCPEMGTLLMLNESSGCLPGGVIRELKGVVSSSVYQQLHPLIYGQH